MRDDRPIRRQCVSNNAHSANEAAKSFGGRRQLLADFAYRWERRADLASLIANANGRALERSGGSQNCTLRLTKSRMRSFSASVHGPDLSLMLFPVA
jgi:hypothetical protein